MAAALGPSVDDFLHPSKDLASDSAKSSSIATMEPYSLSSLGSSNSRGARFKRTWNKTDDRNSIEIIPGSYELNGYSKFLILKMKNGQKMREYNMFDINREILNNCTSEPKISFLNDGSLLVEVCSPEDSTKILSPFPSR